MKGDAVTVKQTVFYNNLEVIPKALIRQYLSKATSSSVKLYISIHDIAASATDEAIALDEDANVKETWMWDTEGSEATDLTLKINGDTDGRACQPIRVISGALSTLTVTNSDATNRKFLGIARIIVSDTTNTELKEIEG